MRVFHVSKSDKSKVDYIKKAIDEVKPDHVFILVEKGREHIFKGINGLILPLSDLNKSVNWIGFVNRMSKDSLLIIDNVLKFIFYGDGKKKYLKDVSQSINNVIVMDVVPFYTEVHEIFYPFWFLGKDILGYNSYNTFKANHREESEDGSVFDSHSFQILKEKIRDYYVQDYDRFFKKREVVEWQMTDESFNTYNEKKGKALDLYDNPIKIKTVFADYVNLLPEKANAARGLIKDRTCLVINYIPYQKHIRRFFDFEKFDVISYHESDLRRFEEYDRVIFYDNIIVKPHNLFYIEPHLKGDVFNLIETKGGIDRNLFKAIYDIKLRNEFDNFFGQNDKAN